MQLTTRINDIKINILVECLYITQVSITRRLVSRENFGWYLVVTTAPSCNKFHDILRRFDVLPNFFSSKCD